jgi:hypothetical protein
MLIITLSASISRNNVGCRRMTPKLQKKRASTRSTETNAGGPRNAKRDCVPRFVGTPTTVHHRHGQEVTTYHDSFKQQAGFSKPCDSSVTCTMDSQKAVENILYEEGSSDRRLEKTT